MKKRNRSKILLVDDDAAVRRAVQRTLSSAGYEVEAVETADHALPLLRKPTFDLVITDMVMPGTLSGADLLRTIRDNDHAIDVIVMTGYPSLDTALPALRRGVYDYLAKPFDQTQLTEVVRACFERQRSNRQAHRERSLRKELEAAYLQLQEASEVKESFMARLNHELRLPLTPVRLALDLMTSTLRDEGSLRLCRMALAQLGNLQTIIESLLLFRDLQQKEKRYPKRRLSLRDLLRDVVTECAPEAAERNIRLELAQPMGTCEVNASPALMALAFKQLLLNAIRFNKDNGRVEITAVHSGPLLGIQFHDWGVGIPQGQLNHVFEPFYQVACYLTRSVGGLGLGLALVRRIAEKHAGTVSVSSTPSEGTTFTLYLPV